MDASVAEGRAIAGLDLSPLVCQPLGLSLAPPLLLSLSCSLSICLSLFCFLSLFLLLALALSSLLLLERAKKKEEQKRPSMGPRLFVPWQAHRSLLPELARLSRQHFSSRLGRAQGLGRWRRRKSRLQQASAAALAQRMRRDGDEHVCHNANGELARE